MEEAEEHSQQRKHLEQGKGFYYVANVTIFPSVPGNAGRWSRFVPVLLCNTNSSPLYVQNCPGLHGKLICSPTYPLRMNLLLCRKPQAKRG